MTKKAIATCEQFQNATMEERTEIIRTTTQNNFTNMCKVWTSENNAAMVDLAKSIINGLLSVPVENTFAEVEVAGNGKVSDYAAEVIPANADKTALEKEVDSCIDEIAGGIAYVMIAKINGVWQLTTLWNEYAEIEEFDELKAILAKDSNAFIINGYDNAWVGTDGEGGYESVADVTQRLYNAYYNRFCPATVEEIDGLMPEELRAAQKQPPNIERLPVIPFEPPKKVTYYLEQRFYDNGESQARLHKKKPIIEKAPKCDVYVDTIGTGQSFQTLEEWLDELQIEDVCVLLPDLKAGKWIDITNYC